jgi:hypothetical protein
MYPNRSPQNHVRVELAGAIITTYRLGNLTAPIAPSPRFRVLEPIAQLHLARKRGSSGILRSRAENGRLDDADTSRLPCHIVLPSLQWVDGTCLLPRPLDSQPLVHTSTQTPTRVSKIVSHNGHPSHLLGARPTHPLPSLVGHFLSPSYHCSLILPSLAHPRSLFGAVHQYPAIPLGLEQ